MRSFRFAFGLAVVTFSLIAARAALAQPYSPYPAPTALEAHVESPLPSISVTISPIHLALPVVELAAELRLGRQFGIAAIVGAGSVDVLGERFAAYEAGGQLAWYMTGDFSRGFKLGVEALHARVEGEADGVRALGEGVSVGPFLGYKRIWRSGFTLDIEGGVAGYFLRGDADGGSSPAPASESRDGTTTVADVEIGPLLNVNLGWSF